MTTRKCERYARERHANVKSFHACVFLLSNSEKLIEKTFETTPRQNNTKIWAAYGYIDFIKSPDEFMVCINMPKGRWPGHFVFSSVDSSEF